MKYIVVAVLSFLLPVLSFGAVGPITGAGPVCTGSGIVLGNATAGGTWSSNASGIATINTVTGLVTGISAGTATITYTINPLDFTTAVVTVNQTPTAITGVLQVCAGYTTSLASSPSGGTWSTNFSAVASIDAVTGLATGVAAGNVTISYTLATGCYTLETVTVNVTPTVFGPGIVCIGSPATLSSSPNGGTWTSGDASLATVNSSTGMVSGLATGTVVITHTLSSGCYGTKVMTVNPATTTITGTTNICTAGTTLLENVTPGGVWSSSNASVAGIGTGSGIATGVAPGTSTITYYITATGCYTTATVTVDGALPISGSASLCSGLTTTYTDPTPGGSWSSSNTTIATVNGTNGVVTGIAPGTAYISYTVPCGSVVKMITITSSIPPITGIASICTGQTITLGNAASGGTWSSSNTSVAPVNSSTGLVTGITAGTTIVYYTIGSCGSVNKIVTVNALPANIAGASVVCGGSSIVLTDATGGGTWSSNNTLIAIVGSSTGIVTGVSAGGVAIIYTLPTGCAKSRIITVSGSAVISGSTSVCAGGIISLSGPGGGTWSSGNPAVATVSSAGTVTGISLGTATISYIVTSSGCVATQIVTVTSACSGMPVAGSAHTSATAVCAGNAATLSLTGATVVCGISVQWQYSADGVTWFILAGANTATYTFTPTISRYYRCRLICASSGLTAFSVPVYITANYAIATHTETDNPTLSCSPVDFYISACGVSSAFSVTTYFGDATSSSSPLTPTGISYAHILHAYSLPGTYTVKHVLFNSGAPVDSVIFTYEYTYCKTLAVQLYNDNNANCIFDAGDTYNTKPVQMEIDSSGIAVDTVTITSGLYRKVYGATGTVYGFRYLAGTGGMSVSCPSSGIIYDTIATYVNVYPVKSFAMSCSTAPGYDLSVQSSMVCDTQSARCNIVVANSYCTSVSPQVTMSFSPDYDFTSAVPAPSSVSGTTITWNLGPVSATSPANITVYLSRPATLPGLAVGDTTNTTISVGPLTADVNTANNTISRVDTVAAFYAPNDITVVPSGLILPCTELRYRVKFQNTGFDTVRNVTVLDTLAGELDPATLTIVSASAAMKLTVLNDGLQNIARFDFPHINILDSTHHGLSDGMVVYAIKAKNGLADGTMINNHVGIIFDDFPVSVTNDVTNIIGIGNIMGANTVCTGLSTTLWNETGGGIWTGGTVIAGVTPSGTVNGINAGTVEITYTASNSCASKTITTIVTVNPAVIPTVGIVASTPDTVCSGMATTFTAMPFNAGSAPSFDWLVNGVIMGGGVTYTYTAADSDVISVTLTADTACAAPNVVSDTLMMTVVDNALPVVTISVSPSDTVCVSQLTTFTATPIFGGTDPGLTWKLNGASVGTGATYSYVPSNGDVIYCKMGSNFLCRTTDTVVSANITMTVDPAYVPLISLGVSPGLEIAVGQYDTLTATVSGGGPNPAYQWLINGVEVPGATTSVFISNTFHDYDSVACRVTGTGVCAISTFRYVFITVNNVGVTDVMQASHLSIFPNPNKGGFHVKGTLGSLNNEEVQLEITDVLGQVVYSNHIIAAEGKIDEAIILNNTLANGMYLLNVRSQSGNKVFHFVVEQ